MPPSATDATGNIDAELRRIDRETFLPEQALASVASKALFYPHSGRDVLTPVRIFAPFVSDFWFCDLNYFPASRPADQARPVLDQCGDYRLIGTEVVGAPGADLDRRTSPTGKTYLWIDPARLSETYEHLASGRTFRVHRRRGFAYTAFVTEDIDLGVFFYRRDSSEGGDPRGQASGAWLTNVRYRKSPRGRFLGEVLERVPHEGLMVTDGVRMENEQTRAIYGSLRQFIQSDIGGREALDASRPFADREGRTFQPVGHTNRGYGPTLAWQIARPGGECG